MTKHLKLDEKEIYHLGLDDEAYMKNDVLTDELSMHINEITKLYGRSLT